MVDPRRRVAMDASSNASNAAVPSLSNTSRPNMALTGYGQQTSVMEVIDLTDSPPPSPRLTYRPHFPTAPNDERPSKRQRTGGLPPSAPILTASVAQQTNAFAHLSSQNSTATQPSRSLSACLQAQVVPLLRPLLRNIPNVAAGDITTNVRMNAAACCSELADVGRIIGRSRPPQPYCLP